MITLKSIKLNNFLSHASTVMEFHENQKLLIDGKSGSGKSGIVEGLVWCLYGRSRVENNRHLIKYGKSSASVIVSMLNGKITYDITRSITKGGKHIIDIEVNGKSVTTAGIRGSQEYIENEILKSSYLLFINSIAYPQDNVENFVKQSADKRKDIIMEIINASAYDGYYEKTRTAITDRQNEMAVSANKKEFLNKEMEISEKASEGLSEAQEELKNSEQKADSVLKELKVVQSVLNDLALKKGALSPLKKTITGYEESIDIFKDSTKIAKEKLIEIEGIDLPALKLKADSIVGVEANIAELEALETTAFAWSDEYNKVLREMPVRTEYESQIAELNKRLIAVVNEEIFMCPELNKTCPVLKDKNDARAMEIECDIRGLKVKDEEQEMSIKMYENKLLALGSTPMTDKEGLNNLRNQLHDLFQIKAQYDKYADKDKVKENIRKLCDDNALQILKYVNLIDKNKKEIEEAEISLLGHDKYIEEEVKLERVNSDITAEMITTKSDIAAKEGAKRKTVELKDSIKKLKGEGKETEEELENLLLLKEAFSPKGIKTIVVDYVIPKIESKINEILGQLSDFSVKLDTQRSGVKNDTTIEGLFITIINDMGEEFDYNNYSGGEKLKITVAITEALAEIQEISFRILDELFVGLDEDSTESFADVMNTLNSRFSQMICITHLREIKEMFPEKITMVKTNGTTKIL